MQDFSSVDIQWISAYLMRSTCLVGGQQVSKLKTWHSSVLSHLIVRLLAEIKCPIKD